MLWRGCDVLILDEPTAVLTPGEVRDLFKVLRGLVADGMTVVLITHKLDEVLEIADHVTVMRRGAVVAELPRAELSADAIARAMVGRPVSLAIEKAPPKAAPDGPAALELRELHVAGARGLAAVRGVSLTVRAGEILGIAGVEGNGQSELIDAIVGLRAAAGGSIWIGGRDVTDAPVYERYRAGLAHVPEDRHDRALILDYPIEDNLILGLQRDFVRRPGLLDLLDRRRIRKRAADLIQQFDVRPAEPRHVVSDMSGGNQQKVVVARELSRKAPSVLICAQPTRGVDIGAIEAIHRRMLEARDRGLAVLLLSAELSELKSLSDRLAVMYKGKLVATLEAEDLAAELALERVGAMMVGAASGVGGPGRPRTISEGAPAMIRRELITIGLALLAAFVAGSALIWVIGESPLEIYRLLIATTWGTSYGIGQVLAKATPLVFTGLSVALAFRAGLFNIGAEGQLAAGSFAAAVCGALVPAGHARPARRPRLRRRRDGRRGPDRRGPRPSSRRASAPTR